MVDKELQMSVVTLLAIITDNCFVIGNNESYQSDEISDSPLSLVILAAPVRVHVQGQRKYQPLWMWHIRTFEQQFVFRSGQKLRRYTTALCVLLITSQSRSKQTGTPGCWARDPGSCFGNVAFSVSLQSYLSVKMSDLRYGVVAYRPAKMAPEQWDKIHQIVPEQLYLA